MHKLNPKKMFIVSALALSLLLGSCSSLGRAIIKQVAPSEKTVTTRESTALETSTSKGLRTSTQSTTTTTTTAATTRASTTVSTATTTVETTLPPPAETSALGALAPHTVEAPLPSGWTRLTTPEEVAAMFYTEVSGFDRYAFAAESPAVYMYAYAAEAGPTWQDMINIAEGFKDAIAADGLEKAQADYLDFGYSERELENYKLINSGETLDAATQAYIIQESYLSTWLYDLEQDDPNYELLDFSETSVNAAPAQLATYMTSGEGEERLTYMEADLYVDEQMYVIMAWTSDADFDAAKSEIETVFGNLQFTKK